MPDRYFSQDPIDGREVALAGPEAHHMLHVMRVRRGDEAIVFDGGGCEYLAVVEQTSRSEVRLLVLERREVDRELPSPLTLGVSLPKGDRQKWLVEKAVELGVSRLVPLTTERSVAQPADHAVSRLERSVIEASKQCGRNRLMEIAQPQSWSEFVVGAGPSLRLVAHPGPYVRLSSLTCPAGQAEKSGVQQPIFLAVGPEGGFTADEIALSTAAGWQPIDLGPRILRIETAATVLVALVAESLRDSKPNLPIPE